MRFRFEKSHLFSILLAALTAVLLSCGGGGSSANNSTSDTGTVALVLTDAISDEFDQIWLTITGASLLGEEDPVVLFDGETDIDLLALEDYSDFLALANEVPAGSYSKIRLYISEIKLVKLDEDGLEILAETEYPSLPANGKIDLNPQGDFDVLAGQTLTIELDIDANKSIHIVETGSGGYKFRPVVFVNILAIDELGLVRLAGTIDSIDESSVILCSVTGVLGDADSEGDDCVQVLFSESTGFFDESGLAIVEADLMIGQDVYVIGIFEDSDDEMVQISALTLQLGGADASAIFLGEVSAVYDEMTGELSMLLTPGQGFEPETVLPLVIDPSTAIFTPEGEPLTPADLLLEDELEVNGVLVLSETDPDLIRAVAILRSDSDDESEGLESISGVIDAINTETGVIEVTTDDLEPEFACLVSDGENIFLISDDEEGIDADLIDLSELVVGMEVEAFISGNEGDCLVAQSIIAAATAQE